MRETRRERERASRLALSLQTEPAQTRSGRPFALQAPRTPAASHPGASVPARVVLSMTNEVVGNAAWALWASLTPRHI